MHIALDAIGEGWLGGTRAAVAGFLVGLLLTFLFVRINTRLIRAKVSWWFHDIESDGGTHVHHMVFGVVIMATIGFVEIAAQPIGLPAQLLALVFGAGVALTLDEFALILHLQDVYWTNEGRLSVDAVIVVVCVAGLFVMGMNPFSGWGSGDSATRITIAVVMSTNLIPVLICVFKGKLWTALFGLFIPFMAIVGAIRLARPTSPWAHKRYPRRPMRLARAARREVRINDHVDAWRTAFFDLIAGKPHLPSLPPPGAAPAPTSAAEVAAQAETAEPAGTSETASPPEPPKS